MAKDNFPLEENLLEFRTDKVKALLDTFPKAKNGQPYLRLKDGRRVFFNIFLRKY